MRKILGFLKVLTTWQQGVRTILYTVNGVEAKTRRDTIKLMVALVPHLKVSFLTMTGCMDVCIDNRYDVQPSKVIVSFEGDDTETHIFLDEGFSDEAYNLSKMWESVQNHVEKYDTVQKEDIVVLEKK